jgi:anti-sigma factor RsiW
MMTCHEAQPRLSEFADGTLPDAERQQVDEHLATCAACRGLLQDLQRISRAAGSLGPIAPPDHVWLQVAGQTRLDRGQARAALPRAGRRAELGQWVGLAAALVLVTIGAYYFVRTPPAPAPQTAGNVPATGSVEAIAEELGLAAQHYERAIAELEALAQSNSDALDAEMAETLQQNIRTVNAAIEESRSALVQNPGSEPARESLFEALRRKVVVLQATVNLMNEMRKGNQVGAVEAAAAFGKKS